MATPAHPGNAGSPEAGIGTELGVLIDAARDHLAGVNAAREAGLVSCRQAIRSASSSIRAVHRLDPDGAAAHASASEQALRRAQEVLLPYPAVAYAGFLHDAEKEYAECVLTRCLVNGSALPGYSELRVGLAAWLNGLAEAASELRRHLLDRLRRDETDAAESLLSAMEDVYEALAGLDFPDALTGGLRRSADSLRAVLERTRSDVTTTMVQMRLRVALERAAPPV